MFQALAISSNGPMEVPRKKVFIVHVVPNAIHSALMTI